MKFDKCRSSEANRKRLKELEYISYKTQAYKAYEQAKVATTLEINATCKLFLDGVYDIDKAFERIARAWYKLDKAHSAYIDSPQYIAYARVFQDCRRTTMGNSIKKYFAEYDKALEAAKKALEPLQIAFRNSQEVKEYAAECRGITFHVGNIEEFSLHDYGDRVDDLYWAYPEETNIMRYIQAIIANRP